MKYLTKIAGVLFAYFCKNTAHFLVFIFTPLYYCLGGEVWREKRDRGLQDVFEVGSKITPPLTWICLTFSIMVFWAKILERYFFFENHVKVANGTLILFGVSILPFVIWWIRNREFIMDVENNIRLGEKRKVLYTLAAISFFLIQIAAPFVVLCF